MCVDHRAVRPLLRRQEGEISQPPALAAVAVVAVVDRRRQGASLQAEAEEVAEAELRPAKVRRRAAVPVLAEEASEEVGVARVEVEPLPVVTLTPELPQQLARNFEVFIGFSLPMWAALFSGILVGSAPWPKPRQPSRVENQGVFFCSCIWKEGSASWATLSIRCFPSADAVA
jgi:hypothetical protein